MYKKYFKRIFDLIIVFLISIPVVTLIVIISLIVYMEDRKCPFYSSKRLGKHGNSFRMYKVRSMIIDSPDIRNDDGSTFNSNIDLRVTKIGKILRKTSLDELLQIVNVIKGNMSFVGPRPDLISQISYYEDKSKKKFNVLPGITGYAQVNGRNNISWEEKIVMDEFYVDNISFKLDIKILIMTVKNVLKQKDVNRR